MYIIVLPENEILGGFKYKTGLNIIPPDKKPRKKGSFVYTRFILSTIEDFKCIYDKYHRYTSPYWFRIVNVCSDSNVSKEDFMWRECTSNKIILSDRYYLYDLKNINKFNLKMNSLYIRDLCYYNKTEILSYLLEKSLFSQIVYDTDVITFACKNANINVLNWWLKSNLPFKYDYTAIDIASKYGHVDVLTWWLKQHHESKLALSYSHQALHRTSQNGHIKVLEWWINSGLKLKYSAEALELASMDARINVLEWWKNSGLNMDYSKINLSMTFVNDHVNVLEWWVNSGLLESITNHIKFNEYLYHNNIKCLEWWFKNQYAFPEQYIKILLTRASSRNHINVLNLVLNTGLTLGYTLEYNEDAMDYASENGNIDVLEWWYKSGLPLKYSKNSLNYASRNGQIEVLEWWHKSNLELKYDVEALEWATTVGWVEVLEWWKNSGLELKTTKYIKFIINASHNQDVKEWWVHNFPKVFNAPNNQDVNEYECWIHLMSLKS